MNRKILTGVFALILFAGLLAACGKDDRLDSIEAKFTEITLGMSMSEVNTLVGKPDTTEPLPDSGGGSMSVWPDMTRVLYDKDKKVTAVIHNGVSLKLE